MTLVLMAHLEPHPAVRNGPVVASHLVQEPPTPWSALTPKTDPFLMDYPLRLKFTWGLAFQRYPETLFPPQNFFFNRRQRF